MEKKSSIILFVVLIYLSISQDFNNNTVNVEIFQDQLSYLLRDAITNYASSNRTFKMNDTNASILVTTLKISNIEVTLFPVNPMNSDVIYSNQSILFWIKSIHLLIKADFLASSFFLKLKASMEAEVNIEKALISIGIGSIKNSLLINLEDIEITLPTQNINIIFTSPNPNTQHTLEQLENPMKILISSEISNVAKQTIKGTLKGINEIFLNQIFIDQPILLLNQTLFLNISVDSPPKIIDNKIQIGFIAYFHLLNEQPGPNPQFIPTHSNTCENFLQIYISDYFLNSLFFSLSKFKHLKVNFLYMMFALPLNITCTKFNQGYSNFTKEGLLLNISTTCNFVAGLTQRSLPIEFNSTMNLTLNDSITNNTISIKMVSSGFDSINVTNSNYTFNAPQKWMKKVLDFGIGNFIDMFNSNKTLNIINLPFNNTIDYNNLKQDSSQGYYKLCGRLTLKNFLRSQFPEIE